jgi:hypothetical protein
MPQAAGFCQLLASNNIQTIILQTITLDFLGVHNGVILLKILHYAHFVSLS